MTTGRTDIAERGRLLLPIFFGPSDGLGTALTKGGSMSYPLLFLPRADIFLSLSSSVPQRRIFGNRIVEGTNLMQIDLAQRGNV